jgi:hypothetical protein
MTSDEATRWPEQAVLSPKTAILAVHDSASPLRDGVADV